MRKPTKSSMTRKLDIRCSLIIRSRMECAWCCVRVESISDLQCAHIFSRTYRNTRWDLDNLLPLCPKCHFYGHRNPIAFVEFIKAMYLTCNQYENLKQKHNLIKKWSLNEMVDLYNSLGVQ